MKMPSRLSPHRLPHLVGWVSIFGNTLLFGAKLWVGLLTGSVALTADAWHTLTDSFSSAIVLFSAWLSKKPADEDHPFGHGRIELICAVIVGVILAMIGLEFFIEAIGHLRSRIGVDYGMLAVAVTVVSIIVKELMAQFAFWAARRTSSSLLKADGWHHRTDALSSLVILGGIFISPLFWWVDGAMGVAVAVLIFYAAYEILRDGINRLLGESPDPELLAEVRRIVLAQQADLTPHHFHCHHYGDHRELTFHINFDGDMPLRQAHESTARIESALRDELGIEATIHMDVKE
ncbi:MAG TPA: cation transporter [Desulfofustis sp.]|jgi:cation diffusion facilitator family transporter|nr:cation transporter [Desulfofustis sp. PB-SRB1]HBH28211.1 cation transporter [Desulfofustis sp.]HBH32068.1 cation transporter [Desulfofustis sp.]